ncbi:MAG: hypothetical protein NT096_10820 [Proteobacteria bacterium]|nr:hypothetical protein [Pseudomonadota bacterium]
MKKIVQVSGKGKVKKARTVEVMGLEEYGVLDVDSRVTLIQELIPLGLMHIKEELQEEVAKLAGERYKRNGVPGYDRWGRQRGSVHIKDQKIPIMVQRDNEGRDEGSPGDRPGCHRELAGMSGVPPGTP